MLLIHKFDINICICYSPFYQLVYCYDNFGVDELFSSKSVISDFLFVAMVLLI